MQMMLDMFPHYKRPIFSIPNTFSYVLNALIADHVIQFQYPVYSMVNQLTYLVVDGWECVRRETYFTPFPFDHLHSFDASLRNDAIVSKIMQEDCQLNSNCPIFRWVIFVIATGLGK